LTPLTTLLAIMKYMSTGKPKRSSKGYRYRRYFGSEISYRYRQRRYRPSLL